MDWQSVTLMAMGYVIACAISYRVGMRHGADAMRDMFTSLLDIFGGEDGSDAE